MHEQTFELHELGDAHVRPMAALQSTSVRAVPQLSVPETRPQFLPSREQNEKGVSGVHPQTLGVPLPLHEFGEAQVKLRAAAQSATVRVAPQLSRLVTLPQSLLSLAQNAGSPS